MLDDPLFVSHVNPIAAALWSGALVFTPLPRDPLLTLRGTFTGSRPLTEELLAERRRERERG